jgi:hypothetical protein
MIDSASVPVGATSCGERSYEQRAHGCEHREEPLRPDAKRRFLSPIFQGIWLDENGVVAVQPKPSFLPFFENQRPKSAAGAGVKYGSDGGQTRDCHPADRDTTVGLPAGWLVTPAVAVVGDVARRAR